MKQRILRCDVIGSGAIGKTTMILTHISGKYPDDQYYPTVFDNFNTAVMVDGERVEIVIMDTVEMEDDRMRNLSYAETDVFLVCYSVIDIGSLESVREKYVPICREHGLPDKSSKIILVGTQIDLRENSEVLEQLQERDEKPLETSMGEKMKEDLGLDGFVECSSLTQVGLRKVFQMAAESVCKETRNCGKKSDKCIVM